ncbi:XdhC family protein [Flavobacterium rhizosphaerae]|uniref:XdhC family protein n=1 Tax=Flavobacterium rhizosphaerae TaxID=3163298 RepID=A0ABW8YVJ0_9FLAO
MTHEFKIILETAYRNRDQKHVLATVVALQGSSYRKPGVQMLIAENGVITGAVSGGCVEKEVKFQAESVFKSGIPKVMTYDGRYRLGCEGILYILLEPFKISDQISAMLQNEIKSRQPFTIASFYVKEEAESHLFGSEIIVADGAKIPLRDNFISGSEGTAVFRHTFNALLQLVIIGAEHDAVSLCKAASQLGWEVIIADSPRDPKTIKDFPGAAHIAHLDPATEFDFTIDNSTAVVLMNHNYARDLHFLLKLQQTNPFYIGILGSAKRREKLMNELSEYSPDLDFDFMDTVYSPAGIAIGAVTPQEIAVAILSEIIAVRNKKEVPSLRRQMGSIH